MSGRTILLGHAPSNTGCLFQFPGVCMIQASVMVYEGAPRRVVSRSTGLETSTGQSRWGH